MQSSPSDFETVVLAGILWVSVALLLASLVWLTAIVLRRIATNAREARDTRRAARVRSYLYAAIKSPVMPTPETLPQITQADRPAIMKAALDILRNISGADSARVITVLSMGQLDDFLRRTARTGRRGQRITAISLLGYMPAPENADCLLTCASDRNIYVQMAALRALARFGDADRIGAVVDILRRTRTGSSILLADVLRRFGPGAVPALIRLAAPGSASEIRVAAVQAVGTIGALSAADQLAPLLDDDDPALRAAVIAAIARLGDIRFGDAFIGHMDDPDPRVRAAAIRAVGKLKLRRALAPLSRALDDSAWRVRFLAAEALVDLGLPGRAILRARERGTPDAGATIARQMLNQLGEAA